MSNSFVTIAERLRQERTRLAMTQAAFAHGVGVSLNSQNNYETGKRSPDLEYMQKAAAMGLDVQYVITGQRKSSDPPAARAHERAMPYMKLMRECLAAAEAAITARGLVLESDHKARIYWAVYELSLPSGEVNAQAIEALLNMIEPAKTPGPA